MFVPVVDDNISSGEVYTFAPDTLKNSLSLSFHNDLSCYSVAAHWMVRKGATAGALAYGHVFFEFDNESSLELDGLDNYKELSWDKIMLLADRKKRSDNYGYAKNVRTSASIIFGNGSVWADSGECDDEQFRDLVNTWFALPNVPEGSDAWVKLKKNKYA